MSECLVVKVVRQNTTFHRGHGFDPGLAWVYMKYCYINNKTMKVNWELNSKPLTNKFASYTTTLHP